MTISERISEEISLGEASLDGLGGLFVAWLFEQGEHVLLVSLYTGLVERIDTEDVTRDTAGTLEEVDELAEVVLIELVNLNLEVGHAAIDMSNLGAQFGHLVDLIDTLASEEVETIEILFVGRNYNGAVGILDGDDCFEDGTLAFLDPLAHGVKVGGEIDRSREDALVVLTLGFTEELLPPLGHIVELGLIVHQNLCLLAELIEGIANCSILCSRILGIGNIHARSLLHILGATNESLDVIASNGDGDETYWSEHGETSSHIVGNDILLVAFLRSKGAESATLGIGDSNDALLSLGLANLLLKHRLENTESQRGLGRRTRLRDIDDAKLLLLQNVEEVGEIVFADVIAGINYNRILAAGLISIKSTCQCLVDGAWAKIRTADAGYDNNLTLLAQQVGCGLYVVEELLGDA